MIVIGIDPGKTDGGIAIMDDWQVLEVIPMPVSGKYVDFRAVAEVFLKHAYLKYATAVIEKVGAMPGQGVTSMFNFGFVTGGLYGVTAALNIPTRQVTPHAWKKVVLAGTDRSKLAAVDYVRRAYPDVNLLPTPRSRKPRAGMAEAVCIAEWGVRLLKRDKP